MSAATSIRVPIPHSNQFVEIFPEDVTSDNREDICDLLASYACSFDIWLAVAMEFYRCGDIKEMKSLMLTYVKYSNDLQRKELVAITTGMALGSCLSAHAEDTPIDSLMEAFSARVKEIDKIGGDEFTELMKVYYKLLQGNFSTLPQELVGCQKAANKKNNVFVKYCVELVYACFEYKQGNFVKAQSHLKAAIEMNPGCDASVRVAYAICCIKLNDLPRARLALERSLQQDTGYSNAWLIMSLVETLESRNDRTRRLKYREMAFQYALLASAIDRKNYAARNQVALSLLYTWNTTSVDCFVANSRQIVFDGSATLKLSSGDNFKLGGHNGVFTIESIHHFSMTDSQVEHVVSELNPRGDLVMLMIPENESLPDSALNTKVGFQVREIGEVESEMRDVIANCTVRMDLADSHFILGKCYHMKNHLSAAMDEYNKSLSYNSKMHLAAFELGRLHYSHGNVDLAADYLRSVATANPLDRDAQTLLMLIRSEKGDQISVDTVKSSCAGSQFEYDVWIAQAALHQRNKAHFQSALTCYTRALECAPYCNQQPPADIYGNMAVLSHSLSKLNDSLNFTKSMYHNMANEFVEEHYSFKCYEFEGIFYDWKEDVSTVSIRSVEDELGNCYHMTVEAEEGCSSYFKVKVGEEVVVDDVMCTVEYCSHDYIVLKQPYFVQITQGDMHKFKKKVYNGKFSHANITQAYNFARVLEDLGKYQAAMELYSNLIKMHSSFVECYVRMSRIQRDLGNYDVAIKWIKEALVIDPKYEDAIFCLGDIYARNHNWDEAKKQYESILSDLRNRGGTTRDPRATVSLGNLYFGASQSNYSEKSLRQSSAFYLGALKNDRNNFYAAMGVGMYCAELKHYDVAKDILVKLREDDVMNEDIISNLANVHYAQGRYGEATGLLKCAINESLQHCRGGNTKLFQRFEALVSSLVHFGQYAQALQYALRAVHQDPMAVRSWYNVAIVTRNLVSSVKNQKLESTVKSSLNSIESAMNILKFLAANYANYCKKSFSEEALKQLARSCDEKRSRLHEDLSEVEAAKQKRIAQAAAAAAAKSPRQSQSPRMFDSSSDSNSNNNSSNVSNDAMQQVSETDREPSNNGIRTESNQTQGDSNNAVDQTELDAVFGADDDDDDDDDNNENDDNDNNNRDIADGDDDDALFSNDNDNNNNNNNNGSGKRKIVDSDDDDDTSTSPKRQRK